MYVFYFVRYHSGQTPGGYSGPVRIHKSHTGIEPKWARLSPAAQILCPAVFSSQVPGTSLSEKKAIRERREARLKLSQWEQSVPLSAAWIDARWLQGMTESASWSLWEVPIRLLEAFQWRIPASAEKGVRHWREEIWDAVAGQPII